MTSRSSLHTTPIAAKFASPSSSSVVTTVSTIKSDPSRLDDLVEMEGVLAQLAAVVPRADLDDARGAGGADADAHRRFHRAHVEAVDHNLVDGLRVVRQAAPSQPAEGGAVLVVRRCL